MPLVATITHPTVAGPFEGYLVVDRLTLSARDKAGRIDFGVWRNKADYEAGLAPIDVKTLILTRDGEPAVAEVKDENNNVVVPARAAVLSYDQVRAAFPALFANVIATLEGYAISHPDFDAVQAS